MKQAKGVLPLVRLQALECFSASQINPSVNRAWIAKARTFQVADQHRSWHGLQVFKANFQDLLHLKIWFL